MASTGRAVSGRHPGPQPLAAELSGDGRRQPPRRRQQSTLRRPVDRLAQGGGRRDQDATFQGLGCAISKASASLMTAAVKGKTPGGGRAPVRAIPSPGHRRLQAGEAETLGKLAVFSGVSEFPIRVKCATLSWHAMKEAMAAPAEPVNVQPHRSSVLNALQSLARCPDARRDDPHGVQELTTAAEVDAALGDQKGSMLVFVNSVCGCAAGNARPALAPGAAARHQAAAARHGVRRARISRRPRGPASSSGSISPAVRPSLSCVTARWCTSSTAIRSRAARRSRSRPTSRPRSTGSSERRCERTSFILAITSCMGSPWSWRRTAPKPIVGRFDSEDEQGVRMVDVGIHESGSGPTKEEYIRHSAKFGIRADRKQVIVPKAAVARITRLGEFEP